MSVTGLEMADEGFIAAELLDGQSRPLAVPLEASALASPAFVCFDGRSYASGLDARGLARIQPKQVSDGCWDQLSLRPSESSGRGKTPSFSELAYHHLKTVWQRLENHRPVQKLVLAAPGTWLTEPHGDEEKIGLLLGMAHDLRLPLAGIVDMAGASLVAHLRAGGELAGNRIVHLDVHQHAAIFSVFSLGDGSLKREKCVRISHLGYAQIIGDLTAKLANFFLSQTSFDVTHDARLEQTFYEQVRDLLETVKTAPEGVLTIEAKRPRQVAVGRDAVARILEPVTSRMAETVRKLWTDGSVLAVSERASRLAGLRKVFAEAGMPVTVELEAGAAAAGAAAFGWEQTVFPNIEETPLTVRFPMEETVATPKAVATPVAAVSAPADSSGSACYVDADALVTISRTALRRIADGDTELYCWSSRGARAAEIAAEEAGLRRVFLGFLQKPGMIIDNLPVGQWEGVVTLKPGELE